MDQEYTPEKLNRWRNSFNTSGETILASECMDFISNQNESNIFKSHMDTNTEITVEVSEFKKFMDEKENASSTTEQTQTTDK